MKTINIGDRFGRLTVIAEAGAILDVKQKRLQYLCRCECGTEKVVRGDNLRNKATRSCGCLTREKHRENITISIQHDAYKDKRRITDDLEEQSLYYLYRDMK